jgi:hypothetical protein
MSSRVYADHTHFHTILGAILLIAGTAFFILPAYGLLWYWMIPAAFLGTTLIHWLVSHKHSLHVHPILESLDTGSMVATVVASAVLGGLIATWLFRDLSASQMGAVSILGAALGIAGALAYATFLLPQIYTASRDAPPKLSPVEVQYVIVSYVFTAVLLGMSALLSVI